MVLTLPPITNIATFTRTQLSESLQHLASLCQPQVRGSRRGRRDDDRDDAFERAYAIRWLTALIVQLEARQESFLSTPVADLLIDTDVLIQQAASLLAICSGVAAAGKVKRQFSFESSLAGEIRVVLTDIPLDNHEYGSVGAQTWGGACVLAEMIAEYPDRFGLGGAQSCTPLRILELGAGTGLVGLTVAKLLQASLSNGPSFRRRATVVLTDFYPPVLENLQSNIRANVAIFADESDTDHAISVSSHSLDWSSFSSMETVSSVLSTPFDVVFGADIVYEALHAVWIRDCLKSLLSYSDSSSGGPAFHLVIPLRPTHTFESDTVEEVFGYKDRVLEGSQRELVILSKESFICEAYGGGGWPERNSMADDVEYVYYRIGWTR